MQIISVVSILKGFPRDFLYRLQKPLAHTKKMTRNNNWLVFRIESANRSNFVSLGRRRYVNCSGDTVYQGMKAASNNTFGINLNDMISSTMTVTIMLLEAWFESAYINVGLRKSASLPKK